jgi:tetratricopeptide (TPR) repeat protein
MPISTPLKKVLIIGTAIFLGTVVFPSPAQNTPEAEQKLPVRGSVVEDRAARKLIDAGNLRYEAGEIEKAIDIWNSVLERYPRSRVRFQAHLKLGEHFLKKQRAFDRARSYFESAAADANPDAEQRAEATLMSGICFYEGRHYGKCFKIMRKVIGNFPSSGHVNQAHYYIGLGHFKLGHYSRAIESLEKVGTALADDDIRIEKVEAGRRLYIKIDDRDLATLEPGQGITVHCRVKSGDEETIECQPVGREARLALVSMPTTLSRPWPGNGRLDVRGGDSIEVNYIDAHTADKKFNIKRLKVVKVVGNGLAQIMDGSYNDTLAGVVIGKDAHLQVYDADGDLSDQADMLKARVEILRAKTAEELEDEKNALLAKAAGNPLAEKPENPEINRYKKHDALEVSLTETKITELKTRYTRAETKAATDNAPDSPKLPKIAKPGAVAGGEDIADEIIAAELNDPTTHSGVFRGTVAIELGAIPIAGDAILQAEPGDLLQISYTDSVNLTGKPRELTAGAKCVEGNLGNVRVTKAEISNEELRLRTRLKTASALTHIGNHYKEFGLKEKAGIKYAEALDVCEDITAAAGSMGGKILEETYVQLWRIYFAMDQFSLALAMSARLQKEFPNSEFVDEAILQQAHVSRQRGDFARAITMYSNLVKLKESPLRGEGQFGIAECYEDMAKAAPAASAAQLYERSFLAYQKVYEQFPESGRIGDAVAKMANFYYQKKDYARAIEVFENVLADHPDANFLDVILFNYGRCLYRLGRKNQAAGRFDQLIDDFPESPLAQEAKRITEALIKAAS